MRASESGIRRCIDEFADDLIELAKEFVREELGARMSNAAQRTKTGVRARSTDKPVLSRREKAQAKKAKLRARVEAKKERVAAKKAKLRARVEAKKERVAAKKEKLRARAEAKKEKLQARAEKATQKAAEKARLQAMRQERKKLSALERLERSQVRAQERAAARKRERQLALPFGSSGTDETGARGRRRRGVDLLGSGASPQKPATPPPLFVVKRTRDGNIQSLQRKSNPPGRGEKTDSPQPVG